MEFENSIEAWVEYYDMSSQQCELLKTIFKRKIAEPDRMSTLPPIPFFTKKKL